MNPFGLFSEGSKRALAFAQEEAEKLGHSYIGTEHLLLGLLHEKNGRAAHVLRHLKVDRAKVMKGIEILRWSPEQRINSSIVPTSRIKRVLEFAFNEKIGSRWETVDTEHLLLGILLEREGIAARILADLKVTEAVVRAELAPADDRADLGFLQNLMEDPRVRVIVIPGDGVISIEVDGIRGVQATSLKVPPLETRSKAFDYLFRQAEHVDHTISTSFAQLADGTRVHVVGLPTTEQPMVITIVKPNR